MGRTRINMDQLFFSHPRTNQKKISVAPYGIRFCHPGDAIEAIFMIRKNGLRSTRQLDFHPKLFNYQPLTDVKEHILQPYLGKIGFCLNTQLQRGISHVGAIFSLTVGRHTRGINFHMCPSPVILLLCCMHNGASLVSWSSGKSSYWNPKPFHYA